jgi:hypothetical protein
VAVVSVGGGILGGAAAGLANQITVSFSGSFPWIMLTFAGAFVVGLPIAVAADAPLPDVTITKQIDGAPEGVSESLEGRLVAHSDGFWHLFDENDILLSIPDDRVLEVQMEPEEPEEPE